MIDLTIHTDGGANYAEVVLNNPKAMNSLAEADLAELDAAYAEAADTLRAELESLAA